MDIDQDREEPAAEDEAERQAEARLRKTAAWAGGGFVLTACGLLTHREWSEWAAGVGAVITLVGGIGMLRAAKRAGELQITASAKPPESRRWRKP